MSAPGTPSGSDAAATSGKPVVRASQAAIAAVQEALGCQALELDAVDAKVGWCGKHGIYRGRWTERGCPVAVAAADAAAPHNAAQALRDAADEIQRQGTATTSADSVRTWLRMRAHRMESSQ